MADETLLVIAAGLLFLKAVAFGAVAAIPAGPVNLDILHHVTRRERGHAWELSIGAALADGVIFFILAAIMPLLSVSARLPGRRTWFIAALVFLSIGFYRLLANLGAPGDPTLPDPKQRRLGGCLAKGFLYVIINPGAYAFWALILLVFQTESTIDFGYLLIALGITLGALAWFAFFIRFLHRLQNNYARLGRLFEKAVPLLFIGFGLFSLVKFFAGRMA